MRNISKTIHSFIFILMALLNGCASYEQYRNITEDVEIPTQVFNADYNKVWQEVKNLTNNYEREYENAESGIIKTRWKDNTLEMNFADSFGGNDAVKSARFKLVFNVVKGYKGKKEVTKVSVFKRQMIEQDFLQGWKVVRSDGILEKAILYRLERSLAIDKKLQEIEDQRAKEQENKF